MERPRTRTARLLTAAPYLAPVVIPLLVFLPRITGGGFTSDDWTNRAMALTNSAGTFMSPFWDEPLSHRVLHLPYVNAYDAVLGSHQRAYILWAVLSACLMGLLVMALLRRLGVPLWAASAVATLGVIFPYASVTKIWVTAHIGHASTSVALAGLLLATRGLSRPSRTSQIAHHLAALLLFLISLDLYEIALPLIAGSGVFYLLALWRSARDGGAPLARRAVVTALVLWAVDLVVVAVWYASIKDTTIIGSETQASTIDRLQVIGEDGARNVLGSFVPFLAQEHRADGQPIYSGAWFSLPTALWFLAALVVLAGALVVLGRRRQVQAVTPNLPGPGAWGVGLLIALVAGFAGWLAIVPANSYYRPVPSDSAALRVNVLAAFGLAAVVVCVFAGLAATVRSLLAPRRAGIAAFAVVAVPLLGIGVADLRHIRSEIRLWNDASDEQVHVLGAVRTALGDRPPAQGTIVVLADQREYIADGAEVFFSSWSFRGALQTMYRDTTLEGVQHRTSAVYQCRREGLAPYYVQFRQGGDAIAPYGKTVVVSVGRGRAWALRDRASCRRAIRRAGLAPLPGGQAPPPIGQT